MKYQALKRAKLPNTPGVYFFLGKRVARGGLKGRVILYIGKAGSLKSRVGSYFTKDLIASRSSIIATMVGLAETVHFEKTDSVLEALILEAALIKKYQPKYNSKEKDDKSFNYIIITKEDFPRVSIVRHREILKRKKEINAKYIFGPFPQGALLKEALSIVRKIFPFRDRCSPYNSSKKTFRPCFNRQIGLCPGVCTGEVSKKEYAKTIQHIRLFFEGKKKVLLRSLQKDMKEEAKAREFERAGRLKKSIFSLNHIRDVSLIKDDRSVHFGSTHFRIEAYDAAHISGANFVGVMVVLVGSRPDKSEYRKFKIRSAVQGDDIGALREMLARRLKHDEWAVPSLIVIDGGKAHKNVAEKVLRDNDFSVPVVSVVKDEHHQPREILGLKKYREQYEKEILLANNEAHRFAITYHRSLQRKGFVGKGKK